MQRVRDPEVERHVVVAVNVSEERHPSWRRRDCKRGRYLGVEGLRIVQRCAPPLRNPVRPRGPKCSSAPAIPMHFRVVEGAQPRLDRCPTCDLNELDDGGQRRGKAAGRWDSRRVQRHAAARQPPPARAHARAQQAAPRPRAGRTAPRVRALPRDREGDRRAEPRDDAALLRRRCHARGQHERTAARASSCSARSSSSSPAARRSTRTWATSDAGPSASAGTPWCSPRCSSATSVRARSSRR